MTHALARILFRIRMARFRKPPASITRNPDGTYRPHRDLVLWRLQMMRGGK